MKSLWILSLSVVFAVGCTSTNTNTANNYEGQYRDIAESKISKCAGRVKEACGLSGNDTDRIDDNVKECKQFQGSIGKRSGKFTATNEMFLLKDSGKLVVVTTSAGRDHCARTKLSLSQDIEELKIIQQAGSDRAFMRAEGHVYFMYPDKKVYELYNSKDKPYTTVTDIKGDSGGTSITLTFSGGQTTNLSEADIEERIRQGKVGRIDFVEVPTSRSLFRDE